VFSLVSRTSPLYELNPPTPISPSCLVSFYPSHLIPSQSNPPRPPTLPWSSRRSRGTTAAIAPTCCRTTHAIVVAVSSAERSGQAGGQLGFAFGTGPCCELNTCASFVGSYQGTGSLMSGTQCVACGSNWGCIKRARAAMTPTISRLSAVQSLWQVGVPALRCRICLQSIQRSSGSPPANG
jgi:hypothetical protein